MRTAQNTALAAFGDTKPNYQLCHMIGCMLGLVCCTFCKQKEESEKSLQRLWWGLSETELVVSYRDADEGGCCGTTGASTTIVPLDSIVSVTVLKASKTPCCVPQFCAAVPVPLISVGSGGKIVVIGDVSGEDFVSLIFKYRAKVNGGDQAHKAQEKAVSSSAIDRE